MSLFDRRAWRSIQVVNVDGDSMLMLIVVLLEIATRTWRLLAHRPAASLVVPLIVSAFQFSTRRVSIVAILTAIIARGGHV